MKPMGVRTRVLCLNFVMGVLLVSLMTLCSGILMLSAITRLVNHLAERAVDGYARQLGMWFDERRREMETLAETQTVRTMSWDAAGSWLTRDANLKTNTYYFFFLADRKGDYNTTLKRNAGNIADRKYFSQVMQGKTVLSDPVISKSTGFPIAVVAAPVLGGDNRVEGLLAGVIRLDRLSGFLENFHLKYGNSYSWLITSNGMIFAHPEPDWIFRENILVPSKVISAELSRAFSAILRKPKGFLRYNFNGIPTIAFFQEIPGTSGWKIITRGPLEMYLGPIRQTALVLLVIGLIATILSVIFSVFIARRIAEPIERMRDVFNEAASGHLMVRAAEVPADEIGQAGKSFNEMMNTISNLTYSDPLTGLANFKVFKDRLELEIMYAGNQGKRLAVMVLDVDRFRQVNDTLGHAAGDELLIEISSRMLRHTEDRRIFSRIGTDDFIVLFLDAGDGWAVIRAVKDILGSIAAPWKKENMEINVSATAGIAFYPEDGETSLLLIRNADTAMNRAKKQRPGSWQLFTPEMADELSKRMELEAQVKKALEQNEFRMYYQPLVDPENGRIVGAEALIRWQSPERGLVYPDDFIPVIEETPLIQPLGDFVLRESCREGARWVAMSRGPFKMAVNISALQLENPEFLNHLTAVLEETGFPATSLELEITERVALRDVEQKTGILDRLSDLGIRIALDDFGTGYSSLSYLSQFSIHTLKIDRAFVREIGEKPREETLASAIISLGHSMNLDITAEGVERGVQLEFLKKEGCNLLQGYYFSRPVDSAQFEAMFVKQNGFSVEGNHA